MSIRSTTAHGSLPLICVAVCTRNRANQLSEALDSLASLVTDRSFEFEVVVINNGSTDETDRVIQAAQVDHPQLRLRSGYESRPGFAYARNRAIQATQADWIAFFDDDQLAEPRWLVELWQMAARKEADCVGGAVQLTIRDDFVPGELCRSLLGQTRNCETERTFDRSFQPGTGSLLIRRSLLERLGGFCTKTPGRGEDTRLFERIMDRGFETWFAPRAIVEHVIPHERNRPSAYRALAKECADGGDLAWRKWGLLLPAVSMARLITLLVVRLPTLVWMSVFGSQSQRLDQQCLTIVSYWRVVRELQFVGRTAMKAFRRQVGSA